MLAFRFGKTMALKRSSFITSVLVFAYIAGVAMTRNPIIIT
jgi:hypothetical protein